VSARREVSLALRRRGALPSREQLPHHRHRPFERLGARIPRSAVRRSRYSPQQARAHRLPQPGRCGTCWEPIPPAQRPELDAKSPPASGLQSGTPVPSTAGTGRKPPESRGAPGDGARRRRRWGRSAGERARRRTGSSRPKGDLVPQAPDRRASPGSSRSRPAALGSERALPRARPPSARVAACRSGPLPGSRGTGNDASTRKIARAAGFPSAASRSTPTMGAAFMVHRSMTTSSFSYAGKEKLPAPWPTSKRIPRDLASRTFLVGTAGRRPARSAAERVREKRCGAFCLTPASARRH
jgi:hypothetical protein